MEWIDIFKWGLQWFLTAAAAGLIAWVILGKIKK